MVDQLFRTDEITIPDANQLVTEDDAPVDNFASEKQQRLLAGSLYSGLPEQTVLVAANVGIYHTVNQSAIVPDVFVSFGVQVPEDWWEKQNRCYLVWTFGKPPEIAIEIVSNRIGNELTDKLTIYEHMRVSYYVVYDPSQQLSDSRLRLFELRGQHYIELQDFWLASLDLGLTLWQGTFENRQDTWLRWYTHQTESDQSLEKAILLTGDEKAALEQQRAEKEHQRAEQEKQRADRLAELLRSQGLDPNQIS